MTRPAKTRVVLLTSEPIRERMAGIGIRYLELARRLPRPGLEVTLVTTGEAAEAPPAGDARVRALAEGGLAAALAGADVAVVQGQIANDVVLARPDLPAVVDLYDPFLVENLTYLDTLGLDPWRNDHATWVLQLSRGDFFLCSGEEQRSYYLGFLTALGRVNPERVAADPDLDGLLAVVPFGVPETLPPPRPLLGERAAGERRVLFGGLYDWYDPWPVLAALAALARPGWTLLVVRNPNPGGTPQRLFAEVEAWTRAKGVPLRVLDWVPAERRFDLLAEVDVLVATHRPSLETRLSLRTRFLDALAAGCPVVATEGGAMSRLLAAHGAGLVVPPADPDAVARALVEVLEGDPAAREARREGARRLLESFRWERVLEPLVRFCREPRLDPWKERFAFLPATVAPPDSLAFRLRRRLRRLLGGGS